MLPYRAGTERLEPWREHLYNEYKIFRDTVKAANSYQLAEKINTELRKWIALNHTIRAYPFDMTVRQMEKARRGACKHLVYYEAMVMRANGIPVGIDMAPLWGDLNRGHEWNTLLMDNGKIYPFDAAQGMFGGIDKYPYRFSKVYRYTFASQTKYPASSDIPARLINKHLIDVTPEYTKTFNITVQLTYPAASKKQYAIICTYGSNRWMAQDWGNIKADKAYFKKIGSNILYLVMYYDKGNYYPASDPFILQKDGIIKYIRLVMNKPQEMVLMRKYPSFTANINNAKELIGGRIQGANKSDFSDSVNLYIINSLPVKFEQVTINNSRKFRYVRYVAGKLKKTNLAELEFFGINNPAKKLTGE